MEWSGKRVAWKGEVMFLKRSDAFKGRYVSGQSDS